VLWVQPLLLVRNSSTYVSNVVCIKSVGLSVLYFVFSKHLKRLFTYPSLAASHCEDIQYKIAALTFDCVRGTGPVYLKQVICPVSDLSRRLLRSAGRGDLIVRFAGKHVHRPAKFLHCGSCRLERTSTWPPLTTSVAGSSDWSWKLTFSDKTTTLHDCSENNVWLKSVP